MSSLHPVAVEAAGYLVCDPQEQYTIGGEDLTRIDNRLQGLRGSAELPAALEGLGKLATCLASAGSPSVARTLVELIGRRTHELRALRQRVCGASRSEQDALSAFRSFAGGRRDLPDAVHPGARPVRDFRVAFMLDRNAARENRLGRTQRSGPSQRRS